MKKIIFIITILLLCNSCKEKYEEIHDPFAEEDGNITKREVK